MENLILHSMQAKMIIFWIDATDIRELGILRSK